MRVKLRIRTYDDPQGPAFLEVKRRVKAVTMKHRASCTEVGRSGAGRGSPGCRGRVATEPRPH